VSQILIDIDSPGGSVYGVSELADEIIGARSQKPVVAVGSSGGVGGVLDWLCSIRATS
jgi:ClpP class serine protease